MTIPARSIIELNKNAFNNNIDQLAKLNNFEQLALVIKSNAYGHGAKEIGKLAQENENIKWLCTAGLSEAVELRKQGITKPILVMSYYDDQLTLAPQLSIDCAVSSIEEAYLLNAATSIGQGNNQNKISVHIKIDTGMGRIGVLPNNALELAQEIIKLPGLELVGAFTHLSHTAQPDSIYNYKQLDAYDKVLDIFENNGIKIRYTHAISSSGLHLKLKRQYTILRAGAACYGLIKTSNHYRAILQKHPQFSITPILTWKTFITSIKTVPANWLISYDGLHRTTKDSKLAILPIGYFDGYPKELSNKGQVLIQVNTGLMLAPIRGTISMNLTIVDVTHIPDVKLGDTVLLLSPNPIIRPDVCAHKAGIITNELMAKLNSAHAREIVTQDSCIPSVINTEISTQI